MMLDSMQSILGPRHLGQDARLSEAQRHHSPLNDGLERNYSPCTLFLSCKATSYFAMSTVDKLQLWTSADSDSSHLKIWLKLKNNWASHCECWAAESYSTRSEQCSKLTLELLITWKQLWKKWKPDAKKKVDLRLQGCLCQYFLVNSQETSNELFFVHHQQPRVSAVLKGSISELSVFTDYTLNANKSIEKWQYDPLFTRLIERLFLFLKVRELHCTWFPGWIHLYTKQESGLDEAEQTTITSQSRPPSRTDSILVHLA